MPAFPGFFGKAPTLGDFISRRVPPPFASVWENWLQMLLVASRERLGSRWRDAWLEMPVWHFVLGSELIGPRRAFGVLIPSVDRVGREYPFTILGVGTERGTPLSRWALRVEALALGALDDDFSPDRLDGDLDGLGMPADLPPAGGKPAPGVTPLSVAADWPDEVEAAIATLAPAETLWWCRGSSHLPSVILRCVGLPGPERSAALVAEP